MGTGRKGGAGYGNIIKGDKLKVSGLVKQIKSLFLLCALVVCYIITLEDTLSVGLRFWGPPV